MHCHRGGGFRQARAQRNHARDVRGLGGLGNTAENQFVDQARVKAGLGEQCIHRDPPEFVGGQRRKLGAALAERGSHAVDDDHAFIHGFHLVYAREARVAWELFAVFANWPGGSLFCFGFFEQASLSDPFARRAVIDDA